MTPDGRIQVAVTEDCDDDMPTAFSNDYGVTWFSGSAGTGDGQAYGAAISADGSIALVGLDSGDASIYYSDITTTTTQNVERL